MRRQYRLRVRNHNEVCILSNAIREHCRQRSDEAQHFVLLALEKGDRVEADRWITLRDGYTHAAFHYERQLDQIRLRMESEFDATPPPDSEDGGGARGGECEARYLMTE